MYKRTLLTPLKPKAFHELCINVNF